MLVGCCVPCSIASCLLLGYCSPFIAALHSSCLAFVHALCPYMFFLAVARLQVCALRALLESRERAAALRRSTSGDDDEDELVRAQILEFGLIASLLRLPLLVLQLARLLTWLCSAALPLLCC